MLTPDLEAFFTFHPVKEFNKKREDIMIYEEITSFKRCAKLAKIRTKEMANMLNLDYNKLSKDIEMIVKNIKQKLENKNTK